MDVAFAVALGLASGVSQAGAFSVSPVRLTFEARDRAVALTLTNDGDAEVALQADLFRWEQDAQGKDQLTLTEDLIVAPPSLKMAPRSQQVVRLALLGARDPARQLTYRLVVREIPEATASTDSAVQLPIALVLSMPVFITPTGAQRLLECSRVAASKVSTLEPAAMVVSCRNQGQAHAQLRRLELKQSGAVRAIVEGSSYLLSGSQREFVLKPTDMASSKPASSGPFELTVWFDDGKTQVFQF